jgi:RNA polymerase sigma-54 factor
MALEAKLAQRQVQRLGLVITPQLRQAIKILQLPRGELDALLHEEIDQNPLLAVDASEEVVAPEESPPVSEELTAATPA